MITDKEKEEVRNWEEYMNSICERNPKTGTIQFINVPELNGERISTWNFNSVLKSRLGLTRQQWVNMHRYGDINYNPLCPYCNLRPLAFKMWGYRRSCCCPECLQKQREENNKNPEFRKMVSNTVSSLWKNDDYRNTQSISHQNVWKDPETVSRLMLTHKLPSSWGVKSKIYSEDDDMEIEFDSNWERSFFMFMKNNPNIKSIARKTVAIGYFNSEDNRNRMYIPDFAITYLDGVVSLIEIKPKRKLTNQTVIDKANAAEKYCKENGMLYSLLTEEDLIPMGVLDDKCNPVYR